MRTRTSYFSTRLSLRTYPQPTEQTKHFFRCISLSGSKVHPETGHRVLYDPAVRTQCAHCDPVVGGVLDQHRRHSGSGHHRTAHSAHHDNTEYRRSLTTSQSVLHKGTSAAIIKYIMYMLVCRWSTCVCFQRMFQLGAGGHIFRGWTRACVSGDPHADLCHKRCTC